MKILFAGDVMLARTLGPRLAVLGADWPFRDVLPLFRAADLRIANLECVLANRGEPWEPSKKSHHHRSAPENVATLTAAGIDVVSLANNHTGDFGIEALLETLDVLDAAGIAHAGAGRDDEEAWRPAVRVVGGLRVAVVAFTDNERQWAAGPNKPGSAAAPIRLDDRRTQRLLSVVRETRRACDVLIVSAHWGGNWGRVPPTTHPPLARALVDLGADVVYGHSPHILRGIGVHRGRPVLYATGDFVDDYGLRLPNRNDRSGIFLVETDGPTPVRVRVLPTIIRDGQALRAPPDEARAIGAELVALSAAHEASARWDAVHGEVVIPL